MRAFSFETSRSLLTIDELYPKVSRFNDFVRQDLESFADLRMWHFDQGERSGDYLPGPIPSELARKEVFVFLGKRQPVDRPIDYEAALLDFDRLLQLYLYVESPGKLKASHPAQFTFRPGCSVKAASTSCTHHRCSWTLLSDTTRSRGLSMGGSSSNMAKTMLEPNAPVSLERELMSSFEMGRTGGTTRSKHRIHRGLA